MAEPIYQWSYVYLFIFYRLFMFFLFIWRSCREIVRLVRDLKFTSPGDHPLASDRLSGETMITALIVSLTLLVVCGGIALMLVKVVNILEQAASSVEPPVREIAEPFAPESDEMPAPNQRRRIRAG